jgi:hypothetical protein
MYKLHLLAMSIHVLDTYALPVHQLLAIAVHSSVSSNPPQAGFPGWKGPQTHAVPPRKSLA